MIVSDASPLICLAKVEKVSRVYTKEKGIPFYLPRNINVRF